VAGYAVEHPGEGGAPALALLPEDLALEHLGAVGELVGLLVQPLVAQGGGELAVGAHRRPVDLQPL
jgi:hypothetical protein